MDGSIPVYSSCFFESIKQEDQICGNQGQQFEHLEQQGNGCLGLQQLGEEYSYPTPFGTTLGVEEDQEKKIKSEMKLNNLQQQQQHDPSIYDPTANNNGSCFQISHDQSMFVTDHHHHHHQNWVPDSMFGQTSYNQVCVFTPPLELSSYMIHQTEYVSVSLLIAATELTQDRVHVTYSVEDDWTCV